ncbi:MAG: hypothetical protein Q8T13_00525 [Acidobacteriota bacterium]|nr:hypothetical protein [Acidobacteriota bacterium]
MMPSRWTLRRLGLVVGLAALLALNYYLRSNLENPGQFLHSFLETSYPDATKVVFSPEFPRWKLLLPVRQISGSWTTTTLMLTHLVELRIGVVNTWLLFNAIAIIVSFAASWIIFRSWVFSYTLAICIGFGTHLYHTYGVSGTIGFYLLLSYYQVFLLCAYKVVSGERPWLWRTLFVPALFATVLSYEGWLDFLVFVWLAGAYLAAVLWKHGDRGRLWRLAGIVGTTSVCGVAYIAIKISLGYGQIPGNESDVVFNYPNTIIAVEDLISKVFGHAYIVFTNFLPPAFVSSNSLYWLGPDRIVDLQVNYHAQMSYLVVMNHMFLWRYYAGAAMVIFLLVTGNVIRKSLNAPTAGGVALAVFLIMAGTGGPTHDFIKFRPMNSMPVLGYHVLVGVLGMSLVISFALMTAAARIRSRVAVAALILATWGTIFYSALARPAFLAHQAAQVGLGQGLYPDPMATLKSRLGMSSVPAPGAEWYLLTKYQAPAIEPPPPPFQQAPDLKSWTYSLGVRLTPVAGGYRVDGNGNGGYQLVSPPIRVPTGQRLAIRTNLTDGRGRVCLGALDRLQQKWLAFGDGTPPGLTLETNQADEIRLVLADCRPVSDRQALRFTVAEVTYAVLGPSTEGAGR